MVKRRQFSKKFKTEAHRRATGGKGAQIRMAAKPTIGLRVMEMAKKDILVRQQGVIHMNIKMCQKAGLRYAAGVRFFAGVLAMLTLGGCLATIKVDDKHVFLPALRAGIQLGDGEQVASEPQTGRAIEVGLGGGRGSGNQYLASQDQIVFNNLSFTGPQQLNNDFDFYFADIALRWRKFLWEQSLALELLAGVGASSLGLAVSSPTQRVSGRFDNAGVQGGAGMIWRVRPSTSIQARLALFNSGANQGVKTIGRYELFFAQALDKNLILRAGYAGWEINGSCGAGMSAFKLRFSGPALVLGLEN